MTWLGRSGAPSAFESVLGHRSELLARYRTFYTTLFDAPRVPRRITELCRLRVAAIHGCAAEFGIRDAEVMLDPAALADLTRGDFAAFTDTERAVPPDLWQEVLDL